MKKVLFLQFLPIGSYPPLANLIRCVAGAADPKIVYFRHKRYEVPLPRDLQGYAVETVSCGDNRILRLMQKIRYAWRGVVAALRHKPQIVVISDPDAAWLSYPLRLVFRGKIYYSEYDNPAPTRSQSLWLHATRKQLARTADAVFVCNQDRLSRLKHHSASDRPFHLVCNYASRREILSCAGSPHAAENLRLFYHGTICGERLPFALFHAIAKSPGVSLRIFGLRTVPPNGYDIKLSELITDLKITDRVEILPAVPTDQLKDEARNFDVGIAFFQGKSDENMSAMWGASNKLYQYMAFGLVILWSSDEEELAGNLRDIAWSCDGNDADSICIAFRLIAEQRDLAESRRKRALRFIQEEWNFEAQYEKQLSHLFSQA